MVDATKMPEEIHTSCRVQRHSALIETQIVPSLLALFGSTDKILHDLFLIGSWHIELNANFICKVLAIWIELYPLGEYLNYKPVSASDRYPIPCYCNVASLIWSICKQSPIPLN